MAVDLHSKTLAGWLWISLRGLLAVALLLFTAPFVALMFYASPSEDDFARATLGPQNATGFRCPSQLGNFSVAWAQFANIDAGHTTVAGSGRWLTSLLQTAAMNTFGLSSAYGWLLLAVMLATIIALAYFLRSLLVIPPGSAVLCAGVLYTAWLASLSTPRESVFWLTGAIEYQLPVATLLVIAALLWEDKHTVFRYVLLVCLSMAAPAQHEIAGAFLVMCLLGGWVVSRALRLSQRLWLLALASAAVSFAAIMLSPAMVWKLSLSHGHVAAGFVRAIRPHIKHALEHDLAWVLNPVVILAAVSIPMLPSRSENNETGASYPKWLALVGIGTLGILSVEYAGIEMASYFDEFPPRLLGFYQFVFIAVWVCVVVTGAPEFSRIRLGAKSVVLMLFVASICSSENFALALHDVGGPARPWHTSSTARLSQRGHIVQLEALPPRPLMFRESGLSWKTDCWVNQCMAAYLGADLVSLRGPTENHWDGGNPCDPDPSVR
jgi:hypothetical protein